MIKVQLPICYNSYYESIVVCEDYLYIPHITKCYIFPYPLCFMYIYQTVTFMQGKEHGYNS